MTTNELISDHDNWCLCSCCHKLLIKHSWNVIDYCVSE